MKITIEIEEHEKMFTVISRKGSHIGAYDECSGENLENTVIRMLERAMEG